jgi:hypothetical protein
MPEYTFDNWLADLRSGQYEQTKERLCKTRKDGSTAFCCLGLLEHKLGRLVDGADCETGNSEAPPPTVAELLGLPLNDNVLHGVTVFNPKVIIVGDDGEWETAAAEANDSGYTFAEIADGLERARAKGLY